MERTRKLPEVKMLWRKTGGGSLRLADMRFIRAGQTFEAFPSQIPEAFRDVIKCLSPVEQIVAGKEKEVVNIATKANNYTLRERRIGYWDVVDKNGKVLNEKALPEGKAEELLKSLEI